MTDPSHNQRELLMCTDRVLAAYCRRGWRGYLTLQKLLWPFRPRVPELTAATRYGSQFHLRPGDAIDRRVLREGFYESEVLEAVRPYLTPRSVLWVVGANFGLHAVTAKYLHPATRVVAFEPSPPMGAQLLRNCALNAVQVELHAYALSDRIGVAPFFLNNSGNPGISTLHPDGGLPYDRQICVATRTAADLISSGEAPPPNALIIDAENAEGEILEGFAGYLSEPSLRVIVFEAAESFLGTHQPAILHALVHRAGFTCHVLERAEDTDHPLANFVAVRT